jgi:carboxypeptidase PM20D1
MFEYLAPGAPFMTRMALSNRWLFEPLLERRLQSSPATAALLHTTVAPTMLQGSPKDNVLPQVARGWINFRIIPGDTSAGLMQHTRESVGALPVDLAWMQPVREPSATSSNTSTSWAIVAGLAADMAHAPVAPALLIGATDSRFMSTIASDIYKFGFMEVSLDDLHMIHGNNEHLTLRQLARLQDYFCRLIETSTSQ